MLEIRNDYATFEPYVFVFMITDMITSLEIPAPKIMAATSFFWRQYVQGSFTSEVHRLGPAAPSHLSHPLRQSLLEPPGRGPSLLPPVVRGGGSAWSSLYSCKVANVINLES